MPNTNKMQWPFPAKDSDPWYENFDAMVTSQDSSGYAHREDRHIQFSGAGSVAFNATTGAVSWSSAIEMLSPIAGFKITVPAGNAVIEDGEVLYVNLVRSPVSNIGASAVVSSTAPNTDDAYTLCMRSGAAIYWVNGSKVADGEAKSLFGGAAAGLQHLEMVNMANRVSHDATTPLVCGGVAFNPTDHDKPGFTRSLTFRAVAANGDVGIATFVKLINLTDGDEIASLSFTTTEQVKDEVTLVEGGGLGEIDLSEKIYEVRIGLDATPINPTETVELYSAEIRVLSVPI